jgi:hypothetical protein
MARQLPVIKPAPSAKTDTTAVKKRIYRSSSIDGNPHRSRINKMVEARLAKQFQYFRAEFLEHALSIGIPVPLDMVEDKNGKVMTFVNQKGPRYLLNIIHAYPESVHLLRSSLSFLIVIIAILTGKVNYANGESDNRLNLSNNNIQVWANEALNSIADSSSVAICTNLLRHSHSEAIQELILNLLAQLVRTSSEAAAQMLHRPQVNASGGSSEPQGGHNGSNSNTPRDSRDGGGSAGASVSASVPAGSSDPDEMTCMSYMFSVVSHNRNRYTVMTACAEVCLALLRDKRAEVSEAMARTCISRLPLVKPDDSNKKERYTGREEKSECKRTKPKEKNSKGKPLSVLTRKPPTTALARGSSAKKPLPPAASRNATPHQKDDHHHHPAGQTGDNPNEWAAFKVLLKFLHRFMRYGAGGSANPTPRSGQGTGGDNNTPFGELNNDSVGGQQKGRARFSQPAAAGAGAGAGGDDIVPHKQKKALYSAHARVLLVVVELVTNSPAVAKFILSMPGACAILKSSCDMHKDSEIGDKVSICLAKLQGETETMFKKELTQHHSMSFELTHGRSAKLFNPVSPIARRESAMLSPERCRTAELESQHHRQGSGRNLDLGGTNESRPRSRDAGGRPSSHREESMSRPSSSSRAGLIPLGQLFCSEERRYLQMEEDKRACLEQECTKEKDFFDEDEEVDEEVDEDEEHELEDDSWFLKSFHCDENMKTKKKRSKKPPPIRTHSSSGRPGSSSQVPRSPIAYNPPESPVRRGLGPHNGGIKAQKDPNESLHRSLFTNLPELPDMPIRLEAESIINDCNMQYKEELLERSMTVTSSVVDSAYRDGFYRDGRNNIPISERARRVYVPDMPPFEGEADRHPNLVTEEYLEERRNRPKSQGSVLGDRSARVRAANARRSAAMRDQKTNQSQPSSPSKPGNQENLSFNDAFSDYYQGLLPLNGVGEVEPESKFQLFLVQKQNQGGGPAGTGPPTKMAAPRGGGGGGAGPLAL